MKIKHEFLVICLVILSDNSGGKDSKVFMQDARTLDMFIEFHLLLLGLNGNSCILTGSIGIE